jgi:hypothetical protein
MKILAAFGCGRCFKVNSKSEGFDPRSAIKDLDFCAARLNNFSRLNVVDGTCLQFDGIYRTAAFIATAPFNFHHETGVSRRQKSLSHAYFAEGETTLSAFVDYLYHCLFSFRFCALIVSHFW